MNTTEQKMSRAAEEAEVDPNLEGEEGSGGVAQAVAALDLHLLRHVKNSALE